MYRLLILILTAFCGYAYGSYVQMKNKSFDDAFIICLEHYGDFPIINPIYLCKHALGNPKKDHYEDPLIHQ